MAWQWTSNAVSRVTIFDSLSPGTKYSFDGINASQSALARPLTPDAISGGIGTLTYNVAGFGVKTAGITRSVKQEGVNS